MDFNRINFQFPEVSRFPSRWVFTCMTMLMTMLIYTSHCLDDTSNTAKQILWSMETTFVGSLSWLKSRSSGLWSPALPVDIDDQPTCTVWSSCGIDVAHLVSGYGPSVSGVRPSADTGLLCRGSDRREFTACRTAWTGCKQVSFGAHWRWSCSRDTSAPSAIEILCIKLCYLT